MLPRHFIQRFCIQHMLRLKFRKKKMNRCRDLCIVSGLVLCFRFILISSPFIFSLRSLSPSQRYYRLGQDELIKKNNNIKICLAAYLLEHIPMSTFFFFFNFHYVQTNNCFYKLGEKILSVVCLMIKLLYIFLASFVSERL